METVQLVYFCFGARPANSKFATKTAKKNCEYCHSSQWNYQKKLKRLKFFRNFKDGWRRRTFSKRVLLSWRSGNFWCRNWNRHHRKPGGHRRFYQPTEKFKQTRRRLLIWTLFSAAWKVMVWKMRKLKAYLIPSLTTFVEIFFERAQEKWRRVRASNSFQFSAQYTAILKLEWVRKIQKIPCSEAKVTCSRAWQRKQTASCSGYRRRRRGYPFKAGEFGDSNPVALQRTVWWFLSLNFGFRARDESRKLRWSDVQLQQQKDGQEVLVWLAERGQKIQPSPTSGNERTRITVLLSGPP